MRKFVWNCLTAAYTVPAVKRPMSLQLALFAGAGLAILAGASFNIQGYVGQYALIAMLAGGLGWTAGVLWQQWKAATVLGLAAVAMTLAEGYVTNDAYFGINSAGLLCIGLGGVLSRVAYTNLAGELRGRMKDLERVNRELADQHRMFLAATEDLALETSDPATLAAATARQVGCGFCVYYLASPDGSHFLPQTPAGFDGSRPQTFAPRAGGDVIVETLAEGREFIASDRETLSQVTRLFSAGLKVNNVLLSPMLMSGRLAGFIALGNRLGGFDEDDRRLAATLATRAAIHFGSQHVVSQTKEELARYSILNDIAKRASGLDFEQVMRLVVDRARELVPYDACRVVTFEADGSWATVGGGPSGSIEKSPLAEVRKQGNVVVRRLMQRADGLYSGIDPGGDSAQVAEAIAPITGRDGVFGALCLGRKGGMAFGDKDVPALKELGAIAGVAVENSRILQKVAGQAVRATSALDSLGEISAALTATTEGHAALEHKTLEVAARLAGGTHAILARATSDTACQVINATGFAVDVIGMQVANGQGLIGAAMLSRQPVAVADVAASSDLASPPDLAAAGIHGALCVPISHQGEFWGALAVATGEPKDWTGEDKRLLSTLGNQLVVALRNAELFDASQKMVWELGTLMSGLTAVTSTISLPQVLQEVLVSAAKACGAQIAVLALDEAGGLEVKAAVGTDQEIARRLALELGGQICEAVFRSNKPYSHFMSKPGASAGPLDPRAVLCVPLTLRGKPIGVAFLANYAEGAPFSDDHMRVVTELGAQASVAIDNARLFNERETVMLESLRAMAQLVDAKDKYTAGHSDRVTEYAMIIGREMQYASGDEEAWERFKRGCLLHDLGKINVPDAVLSKAGKLTDEEFAQLRRHPVVGYEVLKNLHMLTDELVVVRSHHERFDGRGYPDGKKGDELPIIAWIAAAADAFDAMTSDRPYRRGMSIELALSEIVKHAGMQFHPAVSEAFIQAFEKGDLRVIPQESLYKDAPAIGVIENSVR